MKVHVCIKVLYYTSIVQRTLARPTAPNKQHYYLQKQQIFPLLLFPDNSTQSRIRRMAVSGLSE